MSESTILAYTEGALEAGEISRIENHLRFCPACRQTVARYEDVERALCRPPLHSPPARLVPQVIDRLFPATSSTASIAAVMAASFVFLVCWIYIYFDFSSNSLIQALNLTADGASGWLAGMIKAITIVYNGAQAVHKAGTALLHILLPFPMGPAAVVFVVFLLFSPLLVKPLLKRLRVK